MAAVVTKACDDELIFGFAWSLFRFAWSLFPTT